MAKAALRVVNLLDRDPNEGRFPIVKGIPIPQGHVKESKYATTMRALSVGDSFICRSAGNVYRFAKDVGIQVTVRRAGSHWRVWRTA